MNDLIVRPSTRDGETTRHPRVNLRVLLVVAISGLVLSGLIGVTVLHAVQIDRHARAEAHRTLTTSASAVRAETEALLAPAVVIARHVLRLPLGERAGETRRAGEFAHFFEAIEIVASFNAQIYGAYLGYPDGSFAMLVRSSPDILQLAGFSPLAASPYVRLERDASALFPVDFWSRRDGSIWRRDARPLIPYDPRSRPWYRMGVESPRPTWTGLYRFHAEEGFGITLAAGLRNARGEPVAVLGVDLRLDDLAAFIRTLDISDNGFAFIAERNGALVAHPAMDEASLTNDPEDDAPTLFDIQRPDRWDLRVFEAFLAARDDIVEIDDIVEMDDIVEISVGGVTVVAHRLPLEGHFGFGADLYVGAPLSDFTAASDRMAAYTLALTSGLAVAVILVGWFIARAIARPIRDAVAAMDEIAAFEDIEDLPPARSALVEIDTLNASVATMRTALRSFGRYVPKELVRDLVDLRQPLCLGGRRREITVLFTDIEGFTRMTETEQHERMIEGLADYFEVVCGVIAAHGGTVDKFIGDAVMAFWGAPKDDPDHSRRACDAVVEMSRRLDAFNLDRETRGEPPLKTRFGLHRGHAFVGNVGARDRFGYTALGDVVNTAARLESANRDLGTRCLVSRAVALNAPAHDFASVGSLRLRGKERAFEAFSLSLGDAPTRLRLLSSG